MSSRISNKKPEGMEDFLKKKDDPALEEMRKKLLGEEASKKGPELKAYSMTGSEYGHKTQF
jgi:hypothetical protein